MSTAGTEPVVLRGDATSRIGSGHVARLHAVAAALHPRHVETVLVAATIPDELAAGLGGVAVRRIPTGDETGSFPEAELPVAAQRDDAHATIGASAGGGTVLVDHYGLGTAWETAAHEAGASLVAALDDLPGRKHVADLLIDPNLGAADGPVLDGRGRALRGPAYVPLSPEYRDVAPRSPREGRPRVLVTLGGGASGMVSRIAAELVTDRRLDGVALDFIIPDRDDQSAALAHVGDRPGTTVRGRVDSLAAPLARADLVISAGGSTAWQRLRHGLPGVMIDLSPNQVRTCRELDALGLATWIPGGSDDATIADAVVDALGDDEVTLRARTLGPLLVDGRGAERIALALRPPDGVPRVRPAGPADASALLAMANDPVTRRSSRDPRPVDPAEHLGWLDRRLADPGSLLLVVTSGDLIVGQVRFARLDADGVTDAWELSYALDAAVRGIRWADPTLVAGIRELRARRPGAAIVAIVADTNRRSHAAFRRIGFTSDAYGGEASALGARVGAGFSAYLLGATRPTP